MTDAELEALAAGLNEAQRKCILAMEPGKFARPKDIPAAGATLHALWWHPTACLVAREVMDGSPPYYEWRLASDGVAARTALEAKHV